MPHDHWRARARWLVRELRTFAYRGQSRANHLNIADQLSKLAFDAGGAAGVQFAALAGRLRGWAERTDWTPIAEADVLELADSVARAARLPGRSAAGGPGPSPDNGGGSAKPPAGRSAASRTGGDAA